MKRVPWRSAWVALAVMIVICSSPSEGETVTVGGSGAAYEFLRRVSSEFTRRTGIEVEIILRLASSGALRAMADGVIDLAVSAQLPTDQQKAGGLKVVFTLRTPWVWATSHPAPQSMTVADIVQAYATGKVWSDGTPVRVMLRAKQSIDTVLMEEIFPGLAAAMDAARLRPDIPVTSLDPDNADLAERAPGSLTGITLLQAVSEKRKLHFVPLDGVEPTLENFDSGRYKYAKALSFVVPANLKVAAERFIAFVQSSDGQEIFRRAQRTE